jgi:hypothetical protein
MTANGHGRAASRLRLLARPPALEEPSDSPVERCDLCGEPVQAQHRHLLDLRSRGVLCACTACTILFQSKVAGGGHFRLIPDRCRYVVDFELDDLGWRAFRIPVDLAFFFRSTSVGRVAAFYPSPLGATESLLELDAWDSLVERNPVLDELEEDVEALLVNRAREAREHWLVPVDRCYELVGAMRTRWRGFGGGEEAWGAIATFFAGLRTGAEPVSKDGKEATWPTSAWASPSSSPTARRTSGA